MKVHYHNLDGLRGVAALSVLLFHSFDLLHRGPIMGHGYLAVDIFFMLSGFVITLNYEQCLRNGMTTKTFLMRRAIRLLPVYWMGFLFCAVMSAGSHRLTISTVITNLPIGGVLLPHLFTYSQAFPINPASWSLFTEWCVNILFAIYGYKLRSRWLVALTILGWLYAITYLLGFSPGWSQGDRGYNILSFGLPARTIPAFSAGVLICRYRNHPWLQRLPVIAPEILLCLWLVIAVAPYNNGVTPAYNFCVVVCFSPLLIALLIRSEARAPKWCRTVGWLSYPLYASHLGIVLPLRHYQHHPSPLWTVITIALVLAVAWGIARGNDYIQAWISARTPQTNRQKAGTETIGSPRLH